MYEFSGKSYNFVEIFKYSINLITDELHMFNPFINDIYKRYDIITKQVNNHIHYISNIS